jgi:hypothetical protein
MGARQYSDFVPQEQTSGFSKENIQAGLAGASFIPGIGYGASLIGSGISLYDAANADNAIDRAKYLGEAAIGAIPYGKAAQTLTHGSNLLKATEGLHKVHTGLSGYHATHPMIHAEGGTVKKRSFKNGGINNPGFNALPKKIQENIIANMAMGGEMYSLGGRLMNNPIYAEGGIHIKPENKGKFNATKARTGKTTEELTHSKNPLTRKRAIFAQNAKKWKH